MTSSLWGRVQTRIFVLAVVGSLWTLVITQAIPGGSLGARYKATFSVLAVVTVLGIGWELVYHLLQQFRWEKDWPAMFGLLNGVNEGIVAWLVVSHVTLPGHPLITGEAFLIHFPTVWLVTWLFVNGPMRVPFIRWRFRGGRLI